MRKKIIIGVTDSQKKHSFMWVCIKIAIFLSGAFARKIISLTDFNIEHCDGFVISGGSDISPELYGNKNVASLDIDPKRDALEKEIVEYAIKKKIPLLGIGRGSQMINIVLGGTLTQNARPVYEGFFPTTSLLGKIFSRRLAFITYEGYLFQIFKQKTIVVNSMHHQAPETLGKHLKCVATDECGLVQAIESTRRTHFILGVQWRPEFMIHQKKHLDIFRKFIQAARKATLSKPM